MNVRHFTCSLLGICGLLLSSGCASVISGRHANVQIDTYPANAHVIVHDKRGHEVASVNTPGVVSLKRNDRYFLPARYTATIMAPGYQTIDVPIGSTVNPWILGNVVVGGIPGLIVDNATGAAWKPKRDEIHQQLSPATYAAALPGNPIAVQPIAVAQATPAPFLIVAEPPADPVDLPSTSLQAPPANGVEVHGYFQPAYTSGPDRTALAPHGP